jgi:hypothetical protein
MKVGVAQGELIEPGSARDIIRHIEYTGAETPLDLRRTIALAALAEAATGLALLVYPPIVVRLL